MDEAGHAHLLRKNVGWCGIFDIFPMAALHIANDTMIVGDWDPTVIETDRYVFPFDACAFFIFNVAPLNCIRLGRHGRWSIEEQVEEISGRNAHDQHEQGEGSTLRRHDESPYEPLSLAKQ